LAPLPVISLPRLDRLLAPKTAQLLTTLDELRLKALGQLAEVSIDHLELVLGSKARLLRQWASGIDPSPVWTDSFEPVRQLWQTLDDEIDDDAILGNLYSYVERLSLNLRKQKCCAAEVTLMVQYGDGYEIKKRQSLSTPTDLEAEIFSAVQGLFLAIDRRVCVRRIGIRLQTMQRSARQLSLFATPQVRSSESLSQAITSLRERYGEHSISRGMVHNGQKA
jgi:hypothetical protein